VRENLAVANYEKTIQSAFRDVSDALSARRWLTEQVQVQQRALAAQTSARASLLCATRTALPPSSKCSMQSAICCWAQQQLVQTRSALFVEPSEPVCSARRRCDGIFIRAASR